MTEDRARTWDIAVKIFAVLATLTGIWVGYQQFITQYELGNRRPFLELQSKYYVEMLETAAKYAYPADAKERAESARRFWQLYSGASALVVDQEVEDSLDELSVCVAVTGDSKCDQFQTEALTTHLSTSIRESLARSWGYARPQQEASAAASSPGKRGFARPASHP